MMRRLAGAFAALLVTLGAYAQVGAPVVGAAGPPAGTYTQAQQITAAQSLSVPYVFAKTAIPFVSVSTGSMADNGVLTVGTALPRTIANGYFFLPANAISAGSAAGWYFTQCSTTTACVVKNNVYTTGVPTVPASPTAFVTTGPGAYVGVTAEVFGPTITVPANAMGANGQLRIMTMWAVTNNVNAKGVNVRFSGNAGTLFLTQSVASAAGLQDMRLIRNTGVTNSQVGYGLNNGSFGTTSAAIITGAVDTTAATPLPLRHVPLSGRGRAEEARHQGDAASAPSSRSRAW
jgi:hypothetical protein